MSDIGRRTVGEVEPARTVGEVEPAVDGGRGRAGAVSVLRETVQEPA
jgi:hypothetical protein